MKGSLLFAEPVSDAFLQQIRALGFPLEVVGLGGRTELFQKIEHAEILVIRSKTVVNQVLLKYAPLLKLIVRMGAGLENIDQETLIANNIQLIATPEGNRDAVGEHAIGLLLNLFNHINRADHALRNFKWERELNRGIEIGGKTIGIIGYGNTGSAFARKLSGFDCKIIAYDKYKTNFGNNAVQEVNLQTLFESAQVLSLHVPLTEETRNMVDTAFIQQFKNPFWLLNLARGEIIVASALIEALMQKKVLGAGIDVFENENLNTLTETQAYELGALFQMNNVVVTPHLGGITRESEQRIQHLTLMAITQYVINNYGQLPQS